MEKKKYKHGEAKRLVSTTLKEYGEPLDVSGIMNLSGIKSRSVVYSAMQRLIHTGKIERIKSTEKRVSKNDSFLKYYWAKEKPTFDSKLTFPEEPKKIIAKPHTNEKKENNYVERCYFLIKAGKSIDTDIVADFFRFSEEEANVLLRKTIHKYSDLRETIRVSIKE